MNLIQAILLGIIQGLTEFLPVSSSGHLVLFQRVFGVTEPTLVFDTCLHIGTLVAVFAVYWKDIVSILRKPFQRLTWLLIVGTIPTGIIGVVFKDYFEAAFHSAGALGFKFFITGAILLVAERLNSGRKNEKSISYFDAAFVGLAQGLAIFPGISRSGLTLSGSLARGFNREFAAKFSFLLSIPAILGAAALQAKDIVELGSSGESLIPLLAGTAISALAGYLAIKYMIEVLKKGKLRYFSYYVFILGALVLVDQFITKIFFK